ncbi:MAG: Sucraseferredoxin family protein [Acidimicrobiia bacterium]|nr:Sucraseferredoxin family protein [Acidimicrobiia bacterium]
MTSIPLATDTLRCAPWALAEQLDPIGTAGNQLGFLLVEWPLPWPRDIGEVPELAPVLEALSGSGIRLQGLVPAGDGDQRRLILYRAPDAHEGFVRYQRTERAVPAADTVTAALELLMAPGQPGPATTEVAHDVLVCTHGRRDVCCGSLGTTLAMELAEGTALGLDTRIWRTSHTGGHRFAPTAIVLPEGTAWAFLDQRLLARIVNRQGDVASALAHYRGCIGLPSKELQALDRAAFADIGWGWLDYTRRGHTADGVTTLVATAPDGGEAHWSAEVIVNRMVAVPDCGKPIEEAKKAEPELALRNLRRL